ncbi:MAG TPA: type IV pilus modification protein PilV [Burkholderiaceae bacterium]|nr:type IV pilus modification protein PilV [Burkholderiaceae bacterium]
MNALRSERGFSLIEVLVSLFVLAIGLLGMAGLQATAQRATADGGNLGRAVRLAYDMADRLRQEVPASTNIATFITESAADNKTTDSSACYASSGCTGTASARADVAEWQRLLQTLPGGQGIVCRDASPYDGSGTADAQCTAGAADPLVIKVWWQALDASQASGASTQRIVTIVGL